MSWFELCACVLSSHKPITTRSPHAPHVTRAQDSSLIGQDHSMLDPLARPVGYKWTVRVQQMVLVRMCLGPVFTPQMHAELAAE